MAIKPGLRDLLWMASGAAVFLALGLVALHFREGPSPAEAIAERARKLELVDQMRVALASASDSEQSAVLATTDKDSQTFADASRAAIATLDQRRQELAALLGTGGPAGADDRLDEFTRALAALRGLDDELMGLAVKNTNLKAYALAYGPATDALKAADAALAGLAAGSGGAPADPGVASLASRAEVAALRVLAELPPHIAEESDARMDQMEADMAAQARDVQADLDGLHAVPALAGSAGLQTATSAWAQFLELKTQIVALSRENTNVRSLAISLDRRRKVVLACEEALDSLREALASQPADGASRGPPPRPR